MENNKNKSRLLNIALVLSLLLNIYLGFDYLLWKLNAPQDRRGILTKDVVVGNFMGKNILFKIPKGITVRDESPQFLAAAGQFEPYRFSIVLTTQDEKVVNYSVQKDSLNQFSEYYSIDIGNQ